MSVTAHSANTFNLHGTADHAEPQIITLKTHKKCHAIIHFCENKDKADPENHSKRENTLLVNTTNS